MWPHGFALKPAPKAETSCGVRVGDGAADLGLARRRRRGQVSRLLIEQDLGPRAANTDVSRQTINAIETEKYDPSLPLAIKIARLFKGQVEAIFLVD
jgi:putative transcriptional regulator